MAVETGDGDGSFLPGTEADQKTTNVSDYRDDPSIREHMAAGSLAEEPEVANSLSPSNREGGW